jgi:predicted dienelactone hydrolase
MVLLPIAPQAESRVGFRTIMVNRDGDRYPARVWYPTRGREIAYQAGLYLLRVAPNAAPTRGPHGLVAMSHGSGGDELNHRDSAAALARAGFVVVAPRHPGDHWRDLSRVGTKRHMTARPREVSAALDAVLAHPVLARILDRRRIGGMGFSAGGYGVLVAAGARPTPALLPRHCAQNYADRGFCSYGWRPNRWGAVDRSPRPPKLTGLRDPRIRAAVILAPIGAVFGPGALDGVKIPLRLYRAERDGVLRYPWHADRVHQLMRRPHEYVVVPNSGHMAFIAPFPRHLRALVGAAARDPLGFDRGAFHRRLNVEIVAFFRRALPRR